MASTHIADLGLAVEIVVVYSVQTMCSPMQSEYVVQLILKVHVYSINLQQLIYVRRKLHNYAMTRRALIARCFVKI